MPNNASGESLRHRQIDWTPQSDRSFQCPVCQDGGRKRFVLRADASWHGDETLGLYQCGGCDCMVFPDLETAPYEAAHAIDSSLKFYLEIGAGIDQLVRPSFIAPLQPGARYIEVGCGFGFGLDYARHERKLDVLGIDPSPFAVAGRDLLNVPILSGYLTNDTDLGSKPIDVAVASEVIEHIFKPAEFIDIVARRLAADGIFLLTTPFVGSVRPSTSMGILLPLLSPRWHYVIYSEQGLERVLRAAGFPTVQVRVRDHTLVAAATRGRARFDLDAQIDHEQFRRYLSRRIEALPSDTWLNQGLQYRLFKDLCNGGRYAEALASYRTLCASVVRSYGFDLNAPLDTWFDDRPDETFDTFARRYPLFLCSVAYLRGVVALNHEHDRDLARRMFVMAERCGTALRRRLQAIGADDGELEVHHLRSKVLGWIALGYGAPEAAATEALAQLASVDTSAPERALMEAGTLELFAHLTNLEALEAANRLRGEVEEILVRLQPKTVEEFRRAAETRRALGVLAVNHAKAPREAALQFARSARLAKAWARLEPVSSEPGIALWRALSGQLLARMVGADAGRARLIAEKLSKPLRAGKLPEDIGSQVKKLIGQLRKTD